VEVDEAICMQFGCLIKHFRERTRGKKKKKKQGGNVGCSLEL
jgi:hypothetical protein